MENQWEKKYQDLTPSRETLERMESLKRDSFTEITKSALESEGFMYMPSENIWIDPQRKIIRFTEPEQLLGAEEFKLRDQIEHAWPIEAYSPPLEAENQILRGTEKGEVKPFHPHLGGRICFHEIPIFETKDETLVPISILPDSGQRYAGHVKSLGSNLVRGKRFPRAEDLKRFARGRVKSSLDEIQKLNPREKIMSGSEHGDVQTGFWTIEFVGRKGRAENITRIKDCHIARDPQTGTFDIFHVNKRYIFDLENELRVWENIPGPANLKRVMALVTLENFKKAEKGKRLKLEKVFYGEKEIHSLNDIPHDDGGDKRYRNLFRLTDEGFFLSDYKAVPPTEEFQRFESMVVEQVPEKSVSQMKQYLGQLAEKLVAQFLEISKNEKMLHIEVPNGTELDDLLKNQPEVFQGWARKMQGETLTVNPDFILKSGAKDSQEKLFVEVKLSYPAAQETFKEQYYRMVLYKLIKGEAPNITVFSTEGPEGAHPDFPGVSFINIFDKKYRKKLDPKILREISVYEEKLKRASASRRP